MNAVSTVDLYGGAILAASGAVWLIVTGIKDFAHDRCSRSCGEPAGSRGEPVAGHPVEPAGTLAADALEALTFPGPYNRGPVKR